MKITIDIPEYNDNTGLIHNGSGGKIRVVGDPQSTNARIEGDRDGMITLANALLSIAHNWDTAPPFAHHHLDPHPVLDEGSTSIVVRRLNC